MSIQYKTSYRAYSAWNYEKEIEDLNKASEQGWQLVKGGCFHSRFVKNPDVRYRYQLDFGKVEEMGRYIETFREQGWEYVNSTFNGWHYFRKLYDPSLPEETYEIYTDRESLKEMNGRWVRIAFAVGIVIALFAVASAIRTVLRPDLPKLVQTLTFAVESVFMLRGAQIMRKRDAKRIFRGDGAILAAFFIVMILGCTAGIVLAEQRLHFSTEQNTESLSEPMVDNRWVDFDVKYRDNYYLDLDIKADAPFTFEIVNEDGEVFYSVTEKNMSEEDIRVKLDKGKYWYSLSCDDGFDLKCRIG